MSDQPVMQANCLCQGVNIELVPKSLEIGACHCTTCRQWSGSPYLAIESEKTVFTGNTIATYDSSEWAERGFCKQCGTHLFYKLKGADTYYVPVGLFAESESMTMTHQIFIDSKPTYYNFAEKTSCMSGAEVFAAINGD